MRFETIVNFYLITICFGITRSPNDNTELTRKMRKTCESQTKFVYDESPEKHCKLPYEEFKNDQLGPQFNMAIKGLRPKIPTT
ncbi:unnamed protein product [Rhizophagus irregularis]|nr:unnamed protein product [Rhizophagus irregularis]